MNRLGLRSRELLPALALGLSLAALVALRTFSERVSATIVRDSRNFLAADFRIQAWRPFDEKVWAGVAEEKSQGRTAVRTDFLATVELPNGEPLTANVSAIEGPYPFYGPWRTSPHAVPVEDLRASPTILVDPSLQARGLKPGDRLRLGKLEFMLAGFLIEEPQTVATAFATGPRVVIHRAWLEPTGLLVVGSRAFQQLLVKSPLSAAQFRKKFRQQAPDPHWRLITPERANRQAEGILKRIQGFLSFVLLSGLFLGSTGVFMIFRSRFAADLPHLLTLRCLGMRANALIRRAAGDSLGILLWAWVPGVLIGLGTEQVVSTYARRIVDVQLAAITPIVPPLMALFVAIGVVALSVLLPLRQILRVPVQAAFRGEETATESRHSARELATAALAVIGLTWFVAGEIKLAAIFLTGLLGCVGLLAAGTVLAFVLFPRIARNRRGFLLRQALLSFARQRGPSLLLTVSTGLGVFLVASIYLLSSSLRHQVDFSNRLGVPNLFLIGLTDEDREPVSKVAPLDELVPMAQARLTELKGQAIRDGGHEEEGRDEADPEPGRFYKTREYFLTKRTGAAPGERVLDGRDLFGPKIDGVVRVSLERKFADNIGLTVGDRFKFELAGVPLAGEVRSLRRVDWFNLRPNFFIVIDADDVEGAPFNYVGLARVLESEVPAFQKKVTRVAPAVTALDGASIARRLLKLLDQLAAAVFAVGVFTVGSALFIFAGILLARRIQKTRELALLKCLGLGPRGLERLIFAEFLAVGFMAGLVSLAASLLSAGAIARFAIDIPLEAPSPSFYGTLLIALPLAVASGGWILTRSLVRLPAVLLFQAAEENA